ncbi:uncharacterized protein LOC118466627 [Anopheles albimanus]|uniref:uncharacterized protein LOC118466627 n=1 Tax=Anopheles albimanus TaxID=7167 RepID=UPI00163E21B0|nr:uncharacterized protein LOC118466627 [Anopheles albimanus]
MVQKLGHWVPYELKPRDMLRKEEGSREVCASGSTPSSIEELGSRPAPRIAAEETAVLAGELCVRETEKQHPRPGERHGNED